MVFFKEVLKHFMEVLKLMVFYGGFETHGILWGFWNLWFFTEVLKLMIFYGGFETHCILWRFWNPWYFTEVLKPVVFYGGFETCGILRRFWNPWYFTEVLKPMVFNKSFERLFLRFKKTLGNTFPRNGLAGKTITLDKWLNGDFNPG